MNKLSGQVTIVWPKKKIETDPNNPNLGDVDPEKMDAFFTGWIAPKSWF